jgi:hypothetical protein
MIITRLKGGLGNQMFQYAAGLAISRKLNTTLRVDGSFLYESVDLQAITPRLFELTCFGIEDDNVSFSGFKRLRRLLQSRPYRILQDKIPALLPWKYISEKQFNFDPAFFLHKGNLMLEGYWQSEKYFLDIANEVRSVFTLRTGISEKTASLQSYLQDNLTASVHIRRGDLLTNPGAAALHGTCSDAYYQTALQKLKINFPDLKVIVFSDEPDYVHRKMQFLKPEVIVDWNNNRGWEDLHLMQQCSHHIIANSSFSWWGAWLNPSANKQVIAPARWFNTGSIDTSTLIPEGWIKI